MKKIIVPTDFSTSALQALKVAADIALRQDKAEIHLVHVYERPVSGILLQFEIDNHKLREIRTHITRKMDELCSQDFLKNIKTVKHFVADKDVWEFIFLPSLKNADLVVMGTHGLKNKPSFIGSNTQKVLAASTIPVLIIKDSSKNYGFKNMVFASGFGREANGAFSKIKAIADLFGSTIHLLRVNTRSEFERTPETYAAMEAFAKKFGLKKYTMNIYNDETIEEGIVHFNGMVRPDLIALETHERSRLQALLYPGVTRRVADNTWKPVLSVKINEQVKGNYVSKNKQMPKLPDPKLNPVFV